MPQLIQISWLVFFFNFKSMEDLNLSEALKLVLLDANIFLQRPELFHIVV